MTIEELYKWAVQNGYEKFSISIEHYEPEDGYVYSSLSPTDTAITIENGIIYINV